MSKNFYFIRHAQSVSNSEEIMCGGTVDTPLTVLGQKQAKEAQEKLEKITWKKKPKILIHSNMQRTIETASIVNQALELEIHAYPKLREHEFGEWAGKRWAEVGDDFLLGKNPPNGEAFEDFVSRVRTSFDEILNEHDTPFIVAHGGVWRAWIYSMAQKFPQLHIDNAEIYYFEYDKNKEIFPYNSFLLTHNGLEKRCVFNSELLS